MAANKSEFYLANPLLKRANVKIEFTPDQIEEYVKCANDVEYFVEKYIRIVNVDSGIVPFKMYPYQKNMIRTFANKRFVITKMPRQSGKSTTVVSYILWLILFKDNQNVAILANKGKLANELLEKLKLAYEFIPKWMQQGVLTWNKGNIELENGSKVVAAATSASAVRGNTYNCILLDEFAFVPRNIAEHFFASVYPTISSGKTTQVIIVSTPFGMNHYYKMWMDAKESRSLYAPIEVHWRDTPGRDDKWRDETIKNTSEEQFRQEFECQFIGSTNTLIHPTKLQELVFTTPIKDRWGIDIYEEPQKGRIYVIPVDTAHGVGGDSSAFTVIDVTEMPYRVVAKYKSNVIAPMAFPEIIYYAGQKYNWAFIIPEVNDIGLPVSQALMMDLEYENMIFTIMKGRAGQKITGGFSKAAVAGVRMSKQVKKIGCSSLKDIIEGNKLLIVDYDIIEELSTFIQEKDSFEAEEGHHDDLVMTLVIFGWLTRQEYFKELSSTNVRKRLAEERHAQMMEDLLPAGFIDDGQSQMAIERDPMEIDEFSTTWKHNL
jgi:hypothetical protein